MRNYCIFFGNITYLQEIKKLPKFNHTVQVNCSSLPSISIGSETQESIQSTVDQSDNWLKTELSVQYSDKENDKPRFFYTQQQKPLSQEQSVRIFGCILVLLINMELITEDVISLNIICHDEHIGKKHPEEHCDIFSKDEKEKFEQQLANILKNSILNKEVNIQNIYYFQHEISSFFFKILNGQSEININGLQTYIEFNQKIKALHEIESILFDIFFSLALLEDKKDDMIKDENLLEIVGYYQKNLALKYPQFTQICQKILGECLPDFPVSQLLKTDTKLEIMQNNFIEWLNGAPSIKAWYEEVHNKIGLKIVEFSLKCQTVINE